MRHFKTSYLVILGYPLPWLMPLVGIIENWLTHLDTFLIALTKLWLFHKYFMLHFTSYLSVCVLEKKQSMLWL